MRRIFGLALGVAAAVATSGQPASAEEACVAGPFMVFFAFDSDAISPSAAAILDNTASAYQTCGQAQVIISGHTDTARDADYNVGLSQRMAMNVRSYLAEHRVRDGVMTTQAFGETRPLIETGDGKSEPQNRRVEITFGPGSGW
jgi:outer membrane protein OmpA-like peptidoglycan-associated protein